MLRSKLCVAAAAAGLLMAAPAVAGPVKVGRPAPEFSATLLDGTKLSSSELRGKVVVVNFWATWCGPCRNELPVLESYYRAAREHGFVVVAALVNDRPSPEKLKAAAAKLTMPIATQFSGYPTPRELPTSYVIDRRGVVRAKRLGAFDLDELNDAVLPLLEEAAPAPPTEQAAIPAAGG